MSPEFKQRWIAALRSGNYAQGKRYLRNGNYFCCLGVACDLLDSSKWRNNSFRNRNGDKVMLYEEKPFYLSEEERTKIGITESFESKLANMNDKGLSFEEIADVIDKYYEE